MDINEIRELIELIDKSGIDEFEIERAGVRIRVRKSMGAGQSAAPASVEASSAGAVAPSAQKAPEGATVPSTHVFKSPIVGTFYASSKPEADPYVKVGDRVGKGTVLCIVEAMKLFNQIECDVEGEILKVFVENGQAVEYGEPLFEIRLAS